MKNAMLMVAAMGLFGGALAESTTVVQPVSATVANVCTYAPGSMSNTTNPPVSPTQTPALPYNQTDVSALTYTQGGKDLGTYKANGTASGSVETYIFRCTVGTSWTAPSDTIALALKNGTSTLNVEVARKDTPTPDNGNNIGDVHTGSATFNIPTGQYSAKAGSYSADMTLVISYF